MSGRGSAFEAREFVELGRCARRAAARVGDAGAGIEELRRMTGLDLVV